MPLLLWTRHSGVTVFPSARGSKNRYPAEGVSPRAWRERPSAHVGWSGYWFEPGQQIKQESPGRSPEDSCFMRSPDWTRTSNPSINSRMLCQLSYGGLFCFRCWFPLQRVITIPGLFGLRNLKCYEVHHFWGVWLVWVVREASTPRYSPATCRTQDIRQVAGAFTRNRT